MLKRLRKASIVALVVAVLLIFSDQKLFAATCWETYQGRLVAAYDRNVSCLREALRIEGTGDLVTALGRIDLCQIGWTSDIYEAESSYITCVSAETVIGWFRSKS
jgi:hypothetical protein